MAAALKEHVTYVRMDFRNWMIGIMFLSQTTVGILGNFPLLYHYLVLYYGHSSLKATDVILKHLIMANSLMLVIKGVLYTMTAFGLRQLFSGLGCRCLLYFDRVGRSMSIVSICLLSVFQAIIISPRTSCWKVLKVKASKYVHFTMSFCWVLYMVVNFIFPIYNLLMKMNLRNMTAKTYFDYCSTKSHDGITGSLYASLFVFPEVVFTVLILWSSVSMVVTLYRHKQQVQHIRTTNVSSRVSPENRATQNILALVSTFVTFYTLSSILNACIALSNTPSWWLLNISGIISLSFPSFGPFILMSHNSTTSRLCLIWLRNKKSPNLIR